MEEPMWNIWIKISTTTTTAAVTKPKINYEVNIQMKTHNWICFCFNLKSKPGSLVSFVCLFVCFLLSLLLNGLALFRSFIFFSSSASCRLIFFFFLLLLHSFNLLHSLEHFLSPMRTIEKMVLSAHFICLFFSFILEAFFFF